MASNELSDNPKAAVILAGAMQEFLQHGYEGSSMDRVAAQAGVAKATVYAHFRDKEALFTTLVHALVAQKLQQLMSAPLVTTEPLTRDRLQRLFMGIIDGIAADQQFLGFIRLVVGESGRFPHLAQVFVSQMDLPLMATLERILEPLMLPDAAAMARIISGTILAMIITQHVLHGAALLTVGDERVAGVLASAVLAQDQGNRSFQR